MEVIVGKMAGFCHGVTNVVNKVNELLAQEKDIYCFGELTHNCYVMDMLNQQGLKTVEKVEDIPIGAKVVINGIPKKVNKMLAKRKVNVIDLTCENIKQIYKIAQEYAKKEYYLFFIGEKGHPQTTANIGVCSKNSIILETKKDVDQAIKAFEMSGLEKVAVIEQTTMEVNNFQKIVENLKQRIPEEKLEINHTICPISELRQKETEEIARKVELMVIIGEKYSANTNKLYDIAIQTCNNAIYVEKLEDLYLNYIERFQKIGVTAGASTPKEFVEVIARKIKEVKNESSK